MSKRVLWLVDDDKIFHDIIRLTLEQIDSSVMFKGFSSADDFLDQLKETDTANLPDIILMDIMMPDKDCWEILEDLMHEEILPLPHKSAKLYIITSSLAKKDENRAKDHPLADGFYLKPLAIDTIKKLIE